MENLIWKMENVLPASSRSLNPTKGGKSSVHGDHDAGDESRGGRHQPQCRADQIVRLAEATHRGVRNDAPPALGRLARLFIDQQASVLLGDEEPGRDGVDADTWRIILSHVSRQPLRKIIDAGL